ncbi:hypothetical protein PHISCL_09672 [Aspergillus sclerotialis]|uniref:Uncharacterized protein n=1 Tax=Aspergillus sclerotialis TaxID=2070753 RepID=A0A3A2Z4J3_9EURO|nr:hypothetical protein PHISCL_09672 [Aspergillus sclerotialis]
MKPTLLSLLGLAFFSTGVLSDDTGGNKDLCTQNHDPGICTVAVVSNHWEDGAGGTDPETSVFVFDNKCDTIIQGNGQDKNGLDRLFIGNALGTPVTVEFSGGKILTLDEKASGDLWKHPPLFTYEYNGDSGDDYEDSDDPCTCYHSNRVTFEHVDAQSCNCWFKCA